MHRGSTHKKGHHISCPQSAKYKEEFEKLAPEVKKAVVEFKSNKSTSIARLFASSASQQLTDMPAITSPPSQQQMAEIAFQQQLSTSPPLLPLQQQPVDTMLIASRQNNNAPIFESQTQQQQVKMMPKASLQQQDVPTFESQNHFVNPEPPPEIQDPCPRHPAENEGPPSPVMPITHRHVISSNPLYPAFNASYLKVEVA